MVDLSGVTVSGAAADRRDPDSAFLIQESKLGTLKTFCIVALDFDYFFIACLLVAFCL